MAITIDWGTKVITVPKVDTTLLQSTPTEIRELDLNIFRLTLNDLQDGGSGMPFDTTHNHSAPVAVGGVTLARVVEIINDYTVTFEDGQYAVNLVGANSNVADVVNVNQVSVRSANSAGLVQTSEIEYSSFQNGVTIDQTNGTAGQAYPIGTAETPVSNLIDAKFIAGLRGFDTIFVKGNLTFDPSDVLSGFEVIGRSSSKTRITIPPASSVTDCIFRSATIDGELDGGNDVISCTVEDLNYIDGTILDSQIDAGTITLSGAQANLINCWSGVAGSGSGETALIDMGGGGTDFIVRGFSGGLTLRNHTVGSDSISIDMDSGRVVLEDTITAGSFTIRGVGKVEDNSTGTTVVNVEILDSQNLNRAAFTDGGVYLESGSTFSGTTFPVGTPSKPVDNLSDAITIANKEGLTKIFVVGVFTATGSENLDGITLIGGSGSANVVILSGASTMQSGFEKLIVTGSLDGLSRIKNCILGTTGLGGLSGLEGRVVDCIINNTVGVTQAAGGAGTLFDNCSFTAPNDPQISIDANGVGINLRKCTGNILIEGATVVEAQQVHLDSARVEFAATCTTGTFIVDGDAEITDNSGLGCTVTDYTIRSRQTVTNQGVQNASLLIPHSTDLP